MRKAQVQMGETIMIVVIVLLLIIFGFVFYYTWAASQMKANSAGTREDQAFATATIASNLPELHCSRENVVDLNCYDILKLVAMKKIIEDSKRGHVEGDSTKTVSKNAFFFYTSLFDNTKIRVYEIYPSTIADELNPPNQTSPVFHMVIYDNPPAKITQKIPARVPITLYYPLTEKTTFGMIEVVRYY